MESKSKKIPVLIGASVLCAAGALVLSAIKNIAIPIADGLSGGAKLLDDYSNNDGAKTVGGSLPKREEQK